MRAPIHVHIALDGSVTLDGRVVSLDELKAWLDGSTPESQASIQMSMAAGVPSAALVAFHRKIGFFHRGRGFTPAEHG